MRLHLPLVEHCARRFRNRGEPHEDLVQVGTIGLIKAVDRFETDRGVEFSTYATPTVIGEIKRHFRDKGWAIRVPRRLQELRMQIGGATGELTQKLGRSPTPRELAEVIGCTVEEIMEGIESSHAYATLSLDASDDSDDGPPAMLASLGIEDSNIEHVEIRESLKPLLAGLGEREKRIQLLRSFDFLESLIHPALNKQLCPIPMVSSSIVWIQFYRSAVLILRALPIPICNGLD